MKIEEFLTLVRAYGVECSAGGAGYTQADEDAAWSRVHEAVQEHWPVRVKQCDRGPTHKSHHCPGGELSGRQK